MERRSNSIADQIFEILERDILSEKFPRGEVLTENRLSELLEVSRTPVREALRRLEQEHLIEMTTKGALVIGISKEDIVTIYEMRLRLEGMAAAAKNASPSDIAELREILDMQEFYTAKGDADNIKNADSRFHRAIYRASGSVPLCDTLTDLHKKIIKYRKASVSDKSRATESLAEHRAVLDAISRGDRANAEKLTVTHIRNAMQHIIEN